MNAVRKQPIPMTGCVRQGLIHARVCRIKDTMIELDHQRTILRGRTAFSCLVTPQLGDLVLCDCIDQDTVFILSVLERPQETATLLQFPGEVVLQARATTLLCQDAINIFADRTVHKSTTAVIDIAEVIATGQELQASFKRVHLISELINTMARHVVERMKTYLRRTEDHDQLQAGQMTRNVDGLYCMESRHTVMVSRKDTKIDGERIHMG